MLEFVLQPSQLMEYILPLFLFFFIRSLNNRTVKVVNSASLGTTLSISLLDQAVAA